MPPARRLYEILARPRGAGADPAHCWWRRLGWSTLAIGLYLGGWYGIGALVARRGRFVDVATPLDRLIPLRVELSWGYAMIFVLIAAAMVFIRDERTYLAAARGTLLLTLVAWVIFLAMPVRMVGRPDLAVARMDGPSAALTSFFYFIDPPLNCFPSMHLALGVWSGLFLMDDRPKLRVVVWPLIAWIGVSVVFVRQHYVLDAVAGTALAVVARRLLRRR